MHYSIAVVVPPEAIRQNDCGNTPRMVYAIGQGWKAGGSEW